ncbi:MAG: helix-turn-helix domain-containing protein [Gammaproteobacteria bacterium]|nr:helix-turn-helix domain-containing protein [Gammaproteobacteria bacterium]
MKAHPSKAQRAFCRKLYLAGLIASGDHNLTTLSDVSGMPRRTVQDALADLGDIGIDCQFEQQEGQRNNQGCYRISDWGPIDPQWVARQLTQLAALLTASD